MPEILEETKVFDSAEELFADLDSIGDETEFVVDEDVPIEEETKTESALDDIAQKLFDFLPEGEKLTGSEVIGGLGISNLEYKKAKEQLREYGLVEVGRGRGGSVTKIPGAEPPTEVKVSQAQKLEYAREARQYKAKEQRERDRICAEARAYIRTVFPDAEEIGVRLTSDYVYFEVWQDGVAEIKRQPLYEYED